MKSTAFQLILLVILGFIAVFAVLMFAGVIPGGSGLANKKGPTVVMWGTASSITLTNFINSFNAQNTETVQISYVAKNPATYKNDLMEAFATGDGPDLFFLDNESLYQFENKVIRVPFTSYPERDFADNFINGGDIYLTDSGILGLPVSVDPLVMYVNKDMFAAAGLATLPKTWTEFLPLTKSFNHIDPNTNDITQILAALGTANNIKNFKAILSALAIQTGNPMVQRSGPGYITTFAGSTGSSVDPAVDFFLQFSDPAKAAYSWNRSMPDAQNVFLSGVSAAYFGFASELAGLNQKNPHLNLDVTLIPQKNALSNTTFGRIKALSIGRNSKNVNSAFAAAKLLTQGQTAKDFATALGTVPAVRPALVMTPDDPLQTVFYKAAIGAHTWVDPDAVRSTQIFSGMLDSIQAGVTSLGAAESQANGELSNLFTGNSQINQ